MSNCLVRKSDGNQCRGQEYKCSKCGAVGCKNDGCSGQNFEGNKCKKCGSYGNAAA